MITAKEQLMLETFHYTFAPQKHVFDKDWHNHNGKPIYVGQWEPRKCYFCGKTKSETAFKNEAHLMPEFAGNRTILSLHECDVCNQEFSRYESALAAYIGPQRILWMIPGKKGLPNHEDGKSELRSNSSERSVTLSARNGDDTEFKIDEENNSITVSFLKEGYIPVLAFKALVKIGISLLPANEIANFASTINWLKSDSKPEYSYWDFTVIPWTFEGREILRPDVTLYKRKERKVIEPNEKALEKCVILRFGRMQYQYFIPFSKQDILLAGSSGEDWEVPVGLAPI